MLLEIMQHLVPCKLLNENNIKIPEEIALVGFGDEPFSAMVTPSITSVNQHSYKIGRIAAETFLQYTEATKIEQSLNKIILESNLIIRDSSLKKK